MVTGGLPPNFGKEENLETKKEIIEKLFPHDNNEELLSMVTETPPHLIMNSVFHRLSVEALNPKRKVPLRAMFLSLFDRRMISKDRKGREEFMLIVTQRKDEEEGIDAFIA